MDGATATPTVLSAPNAATADSLVELNDPDYMENEQTWPTEEEMASAPAAGSMGPPKSILKKKTVPKGTSSYQAAWIVDEDDKDGEDEEDDDEDGMSVDGGLEARDMPEGLEGLDGRDEGEEEEEIELESRLGESDKFEDLDNEEEEEQLENYRQSRNNADRTDLAFPDEVDTPKHIPASTRFARFRGLKSFRTSPWDPYENLPVDYAKIFGFEDYDKTGRRVLREGREVGVPVSTSGSVSTCVRSVG
jgi:pre-rRNA-processing protein TSR1